MLLLFALVLGLSAVVSAIAPPPEDRPEPPREDAPAPATPSVGPRQEGETKTVRFEAPPGAGRREILTKRVEADSSLRVEVSVPEPGDVLLDDLGLRQAADPLAPARFDLLARPPGRHELVFLPLRGDRRRIGRLHFVTDANESPSGTSDGDGPRAEPVGLSLFVRLVSG